MISDKETDEHLAEILEILKQKFESGNKSALLNAIYRCLLMKRPLPEWLRLAFLHASRTPRGEVASALASGRTDTRCCRP